MAQRIATNYANAVFLMSEQELREFVQLFDEQQALVYVNILHNGDREVVIRDRSEEIPLLFRRSGQHFLCESSYCIKDIHLANTMRKAMRAFRGHGIVHRIYDGFTIVYHYDEGSVVRIEEWSDGLGSSIFESQPSPCQMLEDLYRQTGSEVEIHSLREEADRLLDLRNIVAGNPFSVTCIDRKLTNIAERLFQLEA